MTVLRRVLGLFVVPITLGAIFYADPTSPLRGFVKVLDTLCAAREGGVSRVRGIKHPVNISRDPSTGVVHVEAETELDMLFGQGYVQAKDRLFQLEILRKLSKGQLSELIGEKGLLMDKWHRSMGFVALAEKEWGMLREREPHQAQLLESFASGINTCLEEKDSLLHTVPIDLWVLRSIPQPFTPVDILCFMRWHSSAMNKGWQNELLYTKMFNALPADIVAAIQGGVRYTTGHEPGTEPYHTMRSTLERPYERRSLEELRALLKDEEDQEGVLAGIADNGGSNAWVISGRYTKSGKPIIANDPHLPLTLPSAWHIVHLSSVEYGLSLTGLAVPMLPYVVSGHNEHVANAVTLSRCDVDDVFLEKVYVGEDGRKVYLDSDGEEKPVTQHTETIKVRGGGTVEHTVERTPRGPLICGLLGRVEAGGAPRGEGGAVYDVDCSLQTLSTTSPETYFDEFDGLVVHGMRTLAHARDAHDVIKAVGRTALAQLNMVFADKHGNFGHQISGRVPRRLHIGDQARHGWNKSHAWQGWVPYEDMPGALNPKRGYVISANQKPYYGDDELTDFGNLFQHGWRSYRIEELLLARLKATGGKLTVDDSAEWQRDIFSVPGHYVVQILGETAEALQRRDGGGGWARVFAEAGAATETIPRLERCVSLLLAWDGNMGTESAAGAIYAAFKETVLRRIIGFSVAASLGEIDAATATYGWAWQNASFEVTRLVDEILGVGQISAGKLSNDLEGKQSAMALRILNGDPHVAPLLRAAHSPPIREVIALGVADAYLHLQNATGIADPEKFSWGAIHTATFMHSLGRAGFPLDHIFNVDAGPVPGDADTVQLTAYLHQRVALPGLPVPKVPYFQRGFGATSRYIVDFADPKTTRIAVAPGNSGRVSSPHYGDLKAFLTGPLNDTLPVMKHAHECPTEETLLPIAARYGGE